MREVGGHLYALCFRAFGDAFHRSEVLRALVGHTGAAPLCRLPPYGDAKVANREIRVWHGATEKGP